MTAPTVSILITSYNRAPYIGEAIESALQQTFQDYEVIVSDNCSTDNTMEILERYKSHPKVRIHRNETNLGQFPNRNMCASLARGKYIKYLDSDDLIYPWGLELLVQMMEQFPEAGWGLCSLIQVQKKPYPFMLNPREAFEHHYQVFGIFDKAPLSSIIRRNAFEAVGGFEDISMAGDFDMWQKLALQFPVVLMPDGMVWNRVHAGQEMSSYRKYILQYEEVRLKYLCHPNCPLPLEYRSALIQEIKARSFRQTITSLLKLKKETALDQFKIYWFYMDKSIT